MYDLYENIGKKIKKLAQVLFVVYAIVCILAGFILIVNELALYGIVTIVVGTIVPWISSWFLYAFGELVEKTVKNEENTKEILKLMQAKESKQTQPEAISMQRSAQGSVRVTASAATHPPSADGWTCSCGRKHAGYVSSCVCGVTKWEINQAKSELNAPANSGADFDPVKAPAAEDGEIICPNCNTKQKSTRRVCWNCGQKFLNQNNPKAPFRCGKCGQEGPYEGPCPSCGSTIKFYN